jgi:hypothetical protein
MAMLWSNNASTTVAGAISATDTTVTLDSLEFFPGNPPNTPAINTGDYFVATFYDQQTKTLNEIVHVTAVSGNTATIVRGQEGTTPLAWSSGDIFANLVTAGTLDNFVQKGAVPIDTTLVYVGTDTSTDPSHIVCNTVPVPAGGFSVGMLFNIKVGAAWPGGTLSNPGPVDLQLNGLPAVLAKRTDGSDLIGGNFAPNQEYVFIYAGGTPSAHFQTTLMPVPQKPPQTSFYVRADSTSVVDSNGLESHSGFFNTPQDAFKTIQGAINTIKNRYVSAVAITLNVSDGTYTSGMADSAQYIASWNIVGNQANPAACIINCTSTAVASYVPNSPAGQCVAVGKHASMTVVGFTFQSYNENCVSAGFLYLRNNNYTAPTSGDSGARPSVNAGGGGQLKLGGVNGYSAANPTPEIFLANSGGVLIMGYTDIYGSDTFQLNITGTVPTVRDAIAVADTGAVISVYDAYCVFTGATISCAQYHSYNAGGLHFGQGNNQVFGEIASLPGIIEPPSATTCGGWEST